MAKTNIKDVIAQKKTLEALADCMCCQKVFTTLHKKCIYCKGFKDCKVLSCRDCAWAVPSGDEDVCLPWFAHNLLTIIKQHTNGSDLEEKTGDGNR